MGSNLVIVAIPDENDRVWKISSEKIPHLTVLFLGDSDKVDNLEQIVGFVQHAATQTLRRFYLPVDRRDELGEDKADVLFFKKGRYDYKAIYDFRCSLLKENNIKTAYDNTPQFDGPWQPHLTLGYPATPAKPDEDNYGFYDVCFNKIAVWVDDFDGPEFLLKDCYDEWDEMAPALDVYMSVNDARVAAGMQALDHHNVVEVTPVEDSVIQTTELGAEFLEHYGIKGMHWGTRRQGAVTTQAHIDSGILRRQTKIKAKGGESHPPTEDALKAAVNKQKLKKSGVAALTNQELRDLQTRIQLEVQVQQLTTSKGKRLVTKQLEEEGKQQVSKVARKAVSAEALKKVRKSAATAATTAALL